MEKFFNNEFRRLRNLSARVGGDPWQVQGAGGNTSLKSDGLMWIKASGTWLGHAADSELFVPVKLSPLLQALDENDQEAEKSVSFIEQSLNPNNLRPSIETTVHAVLPQKVVVHIHCVDTIALAVQSNAQKTLSKLLQHHRWLWVPYFRPGLPLSRYISAHLQPDTNVIVLGNHGLVVAAETVEQAGELLESVRAAVKQQVRTALPPLSNTLSGLCANTEYEPARNNETHAIAMDETGLKVADGGSLYPDHVIFLGQGSVIMESSDSVPQVSTQRETTQGSRPASIIVAGCGVLMHRKSNDSQHAMARCLSDVCLRIAKDTSINYLSDDDHYQLLNWEAESFRQSTAR